MFGKMFFAGAVTVATLAVMPAAAQAQYAAPGYAAVVPVQYYGGDRGDRGRRDWGDRRGYGRRGYDGPRGYYEGRGYGRGYAPRFAGGYGGYGYGRGYRDDR